MTTLTIATALWMALLLGGWSLVGRSLGRATANPGHAADDEVPDRPDTHPASR